MAANSSLPSDTSSPSAHKAPNPLSQQELNAVSAELDAIISSAKKSLQEWTSLGGSRDTEAIKAIVDAARLLTEADAKVRKDIYRHKVEAAEKELSQKVVRLEGLISGSGGAALEQLGTCRSSGTGIQDVPVRPDADADAPIDDYYEYELED